MVPKKKCGKKKACLNSVKLLFSVKVFRTLFHSFIHSMSILENIFFPVVVRSPLAVAAIVVVDIINVSTMLISLSPSLSLFTKKNYHREKISIFTRSSNGSGNQSLNNQVSFGSFLFFFPPPRIICFSVFYSFPPFFSYSFCFS